MRGDLFLFAGEDPEGGFAWSKVDAGGKVEFGRAASGEPIAAAQDADRVVLILPGEAVSVHAVLLPARSEPQAQAAAAFAVEDYIAQPMDAVYAALGPKPAPGGLRAIAVTTKATLDDWRRDAVAMAGKLTHAAADYAALPSLEEAVTILDVGDRVLVRWGAEGFAIEDEHAPEVLAAFLEARPIEGVRIWSDRPDALISRDVAGEGAFDVRPAPVDAELARMFREGLEAGLGVDLARAGGASADEALFDWRPWRFALAAAGVAIVAYVTLLFTEAAFLRAQIRQADELAATQLTAVFPDITRVVNPRAQMRSRLDALGGSGALAFLELSALLSDAVADVESVQVDALRFDDARAELALSVLYPSYDSIEALRAAIEARGGVMEEGASRRQGELTLGELTVRAR